GPRPRRDGAPRSAASFEKHVQVPHPGPLPMTRLCPSERDNWRSVSRPIARRSRGEIVWPQTIWRRTLRAAASGSAGIGKRRRLFRTPEAHQMKIMHNVSGHLFTIALAAGIAACSHAQPKADGSGQQTQPQAQATEAGKNVTPEAYHAQGQADLDKALEELRAVSVFFEFDSATLTTDAKEKLSAVGDVLVKHQELKVRI